MGWMMGAGLGFLLGGPLGAIVGGAMQHFLTGESRESFSIAGPAAGQAQFVSYLVAIMTKVAMADGRVADSEKQVIHNFFAAELNYSGMELRYVDGLIHETQRVNPDLGSLARAFREVSGREGALLLLDICYRVAAADGHISTQEQHELGFLSDALRITREEHERIKYKYSGFKGSGHHSTGEQVKPPAPGDYTALGITPDASDQEVKKAYRQMAAQYHPDKVNHLGQELVDFANKKFAEINTAYENIKKSRGIK